MSAAAPPKPSNADEAKEKQPEEVFEEDFWERYSPHFEFPLANVASVIIHIVVFGLFLYYISRLLQVDEKTAPPVRGMMVIDNDTGTGMGSEGSGGGHQEAKETDIRPQDAGQPLPEAELKREMVSVSTWAPELAQNPEALEAIANSPNREKLEKLGESLKKRLAGVGDKKGAGDNQGESRTGQTGKGDGGAGDATSSQRRSGRWILLFRTESGRDYVSQLASLQAHIVVKKGEGRYIHFSDLKDLSVRKEVTEQQIPAEMMNFIDDNPESVRKVAEALGLDFTPPNFIALVPKDVENDLAAKERAYRNRGETQIYSTTFRVLVRDGKYTVTVTDQVPNKR